MADNIQTQPQPVSDHLIDRVRFFQKWSLLLLMFLLLLAMVWALVHRFDGPDWAVFLIRANVVVAAEATVIFFVCFWWSIHRLARQSHGEFSGLVYVGLAIVLTPLFLLGLFVVPGMLFSDLQRQGRWPG